MSLSFKKFLKIILIMLVVGCITFFSVNAILDHIFENIPTEENYFENF